MMLLNTTTMVLCGLTLAMVSTGCAWKTVEAGASNVPNPVLLGPIDRVHGQKADVASAKVAKIAVEVARSLTMTQHEDGNYSYTRTSISKEGANKISFAIVSGTQGQKDKDVHLSELYAGSWVMFPFFFLKEKEWVGVEANVVKRAQ